MFKIHFTFIFRCTSWSSPQAFWSKCCNNLSFFPCLLHAPTNPPSFHCPDISRGHKLTLHTACLISNLSDCSTSIRSYGWAVSCSMLYLTLGLPLTSYYMRQKVSVLNPRFNFQHSILSHSKLTNTNASKNQQENFDNLYCFLKWQKGNQHQWRNY